MWTGTGIISFNGRDWLGIGNILGLTLPAETTDGSSQGATATLSGLDSDLLASFLNEKYQNRTCEIWLGALDSSEESPTVISPYMVFQGKLDHDKVNLSGKTLVITMYAENDIVDLLEPKETRYTLESQARVLGHSNDKAFEFMPKMQNAQIQLREEPS